MALFPIRNLGNGGMAPDRLQQDLQPNELTYALNVRVHDGFIEPMHWPRPTLTIDNAQNVVQVVGVDVPGTDKYGVITEQEFFEIDATEGATAVQCGAALSPSNDWITTLFEHYMIASNGLEPPFFKNMRTAGGTFATLPNFPVDILAVDTVIAHKGFLIFGGIHYAAAYKPEEIRWTDIRYDDLPGTDYPSGAGSGAADYDILVDNAAGNNQLDGDDGSIRAIVPMGDALMIYQQKAVTAMTLSGTNNVWNFRRLFREGAHSHHCVVQFEGMHAVVSESLIYAHNGQTITRIADSKINDTFYKGAELGKGVRMSADYVNHELTILYQTTADDFSNGYRYNWESGAWTAITLPPNTFGLFFEKLPSKIGTRWKNVLGSWASRTGSWMSQGASFEQRGMIAAVGGQLHTWLSPIDEPLKDQARLHRHNLDFDEIAGSEMPIKSLRAIYPVMSNGATTNINDSGVVSERGDMLVTLKTSMDGHNYTTHQPLAPYSIGNDVKIDCRATFRYLGIEITFTKGAEFALSGLDLDIVEAGNR